MLLTLNRSSDRITLIGVDRGEGVPGVGGSGAPLRRLEYGVLNRVGLVGLVG